MPLLAATALPSRSKAQADRAKLWMGQDGRAHAPVMVRGLKRVDQMFVLSMAAYNLARMRSLGQYRPQLR